MKSVKDQLWNNVLNQVSDQFLNELSKQVWGQVSDQLLNEVLIRVWCQFRQHTWFQIENQSK